MRWELVTVTAATAAAPTVDATAAGFQAKQTTSVSTSTLTTTGTNELLVAYVAVAGTTSPAQKVTGVTGGGLTWSLTSRSNGVYEKQATYRCVSQAGRVVVGWFT